MSEQRAVLYLRVSTGRQAEHDLSIPDQRRQLEAYCRDKGWRIVAEYVEPGASATDDRRPEFQRMMEAATEKPPAFDVIVVHSFSRFFRDHFELEFYVRRLNKHGVKLVSRTQELGDDPTSVLMRQIMALFDEYQSRENAKHVLRSMKENARKGFWNGSRPPLGYRAVAVEQRGVRIKKRLEIDPLQADTVRLMFRLALTGENGSGPLGVKAIATHLNERGIHLSRYSRRERAAGDHPRPPASIRGRGTAQAADRRRGVSSRLRVRLRAARRGGREVGDHDGNAGQPAGRSFERRIGGLRRSQFCSGVARPGGLEPPTS